MDEVAADIFMGTFSEKFLRAAQIAAQMLEGTLYERYYGVPFARIRATDDVKRSRWVTPTSEAFAALCVELAGPGRSGSFVARNGTIIEQEQILTTHNLAPLFEALGLTAVLRGQLEGLSLRGFDWMCRRLRQTTGPWKTRLQAVKNAAYAWRQVVFFLTVAPEGAVTAFLEQARARLRGSRKRSGRGWSRCWRGWRAARGLPTEELPGARRFLGWSTGGHWLLS